MIEHEQSGAARAGYGEELSQRLSRDLTRRLGRGFSVRNLEQMRRFYLAALLSKNKAALLTKGSVARTNEAVCVEDEIKDPFVLEFLGLKDEYSESDLEAARCDGGTLRARRVAEQGTGRRVPEALPNEKMLAEELRRTRKMLEGGAA